MVRAFAVILSPVRWTGCGPLSLFTFDVSRIFTFHGFPRLTFIHLSLLTVHSVFDGFARMTTFKPVHPAFSCLSCQIRLCNLFFASFAAICSSPMMPCVCEYIVNYCGNFEKDPFPDSGWIQNHINCHGYDDFGQQVSTGVYFYRLVAEAIVQTKKMVVMK